MAQTSDKNYLFFSGNYGCLKQVDVKEQKVLRDYGKIHEHISSIAITSNDKYLFTSVYETNGHVRQFSVRNGQMIKGQGAILERDGVWSITTTPDNKWLFAAINKWHLKQIYLEIQEVVHEF
jgi:WD40 repeat protein